MTAQPDDSDDRRDLAACRNDEAAFARLYQRHAGKLYGLAMRMLKQPDQAEDVVQETFITLHRKAHTFRGDAKVGTWLSAVALNACRMKLRKRKRQTMPLEAAPEPATAPPPREIGLTEALGKMEEPARELLLLAAQGHGYEALGQLLELTPDQVRGRLYRARKALMEQLQRMGISDV